MPDIMVRWRTKVPKIIEEVGFDFNWDPRKVWELDEPVSEMDMNELIWHFDIPFWEMRDTDDYNLTPNELMRKPGLSLEHYQRIQNADLKYPIDLMENRGRWLVLDGLHRMAKAYLRGDKKVNVRIIPRFRIPEIIKEKE